MSKKSKIILICLTVAIVVIAAIVIPIAVLKFDKPTQLKTPSQPQVVESENLIVVQTSKIEGAIKYIFEISIPSSPAKTLTFENETNVLMLDFNGASSSLKSSFDYAGVYSVNCYAIAQEAQNNSLKSSPTNFVRKLTLNQTELSRKNGSFIWQSVNHADYYELVITSNDRTISKVVNATNSPDGMQSITLASLKEEFNLQPNQYSITIRACSNNEYYISSLYSQTPIIFNIS